MAERKRLTPRMRNELAFRQKYLCFICEQLLPPVFDIDHIVPLNEGGTNEISNLQCLCKDCHIDKSAKEAESRATEKRDEKEKEREAAREKEREKDPEMLSKMPSELTPDQSSSPFFHACSRQIAFEKRVRFQIGEVSGEEFLEQFQYVKRVP